MGCLEISFDKAVPKHVAMLGKISLHAGMMDSAGWDSPGYWLCKGASANNINRFCPSTITGSIHKGVGSCGEDITSLAKMIDFLKGMNKGRTWGLRILGFLMFWCSVWMCTQPIRSMLGCITNMMDSSTDCIPCVGGCVDTLTDIFMGVVKAILCVVSFCCGGACFLTVCVIMWFVMRPVWGIVGCIVICCCCAGAGALLYSSRKSSKDPSEMDDDEGEAFSGEDQDFE